MAKKAKKTSKETCACGPDCKKSCKSWKARDSCGMGCIYFLGFIGALVYYIQTAPGFWAGVLGVLKALVWPAMLVYKLLGL